MNPVENSFIFVLLGDSVVANSSGSVNLDDLLEGDYTITAWLNGFKVAEDRVFLNSSQSVTLTANVTSLAWSPHSILGQRYLCFN